MQAFRTTLEDNGFVVCPFDSCLFSLVTEGEDGKPVLHGISGIHVDDGLGGGDSVFMAALERVRRKYSFGAYNEREFVFCGVKYFQWEDGTIEIDQRDYINRIEPITISKERRQTPLAAVTDAERQELRRVCGSLQYAVVNTRPDVAAKVGECQSSVVSGTVGDLVQVNRVLIWKQKAIHYVSLLLRFLSKLSPFADFRMPPLQPRERIPRDKGPSFLQRTVHCWTTRSQ